MFFKFNEKHHDIDPRRNTVFYVDYGPILKFSEKFLTCKCTKLVLLNVPISLYETGKL